MSFLLSSQIRISLEGYKSSNAPKKFSYLLFKLPVVIFGSVGVGEELFIPITIISIITTTIITIAVIIRGRCSGDYHLKIQKFENLGYEKAFLIPRLCLPALLVFLAALPLHGVPSNETQEGY